MDELNRLAQHRNSLEAYLTAMGQQCRIPISKYQSFIGEIKNNISAEA